MRDLNQLTAKIEKAIEHQLMLLGDKVTMVFKASDVALDPRGGEYKEYAIGVVFDEVGNLWGDTIPEFKGALHYQSGARFSDEYIIGGFEDQFHNTLDQFIHPGKDTTIYWRLDPEVSETFHGRYDSEQEEFDAWKARPDGASNAIRLYFRCSFYND